MPKNDLYNTAILLLLGNDEAHDQFSFAGCQSFLPLIAEKPNLYFLKFGIHFDFAIPIEGPFFHAVSN